MYSTGYPAARFSIFDGSGAPGTLFSAPDDGLCVPFAFVMAERGVPGQIYFGGAKELTPLLGKSTFDPTSPYFNNATQMLGIAMAGQGVECMRLVDPAAAAATLGLFIQVTNAPLVQYQKNPSGARVLDNSGNYIPLLQADHTTQVTQPGVIVKWLVRGLTSAEYYSTLVPVTVTNGGSTTTTYPVTALQMTSPGVYGNAQGFSFFSTGTNDSSVSLAIDSILYRFLPMALPTNVSTTAAAIPDVFGSLYNDVSFKPAALYAPTNSNYAFGYVLGNNYVDGQTGNQALPYDLHVYSNNINLVGQAVLAVSPELGALDPYLIDLMSGSDLNGNLLDHLEIDPASAMVVNSDVVNYAVGGSDGDTSWTKFETLVSDWLAGSDHGEFTNLQQHPMTHFSDPGFSMSTKTLLFTMLDLRDNFKIDVSTQDISLPVNTKAQDIASGQALLFRAQMHPESVINGVGCSRVGIYAHASTLVDGSPYSGIMPFTLNRMIQRRNKDGGTYLRGSSGGLPQSAVTIFRKPNWVADDEASQALAWANCINAVRHATRTTIFYPSLRTVYPNDTSLLSDDEVSDRIIYMFKICRAIWARYAGVRLPPKKLYPNIGRDINNECATAFSGDSLNVQATVSQTAEDKNLGYAVTVNIAVTGNIPVRVLNFDVNVARGIS